MLIRLMTRSTILSEKALPGSIRFIGQEVLYINQRYNIAFYPSQIRRKKGQQFIGEEQDEQEERLVESRPSTSLISACLDQV